jgi:hypothetical protein
MPFSGQFLADSTRFFNAWGMQKTGISAFQSLCEIKWEGLSQEGLIVEEMQIKGENSWFETLANLLMGGMKEILTMTWGIVSIVKAQEGNCNNRLEMQGIGN